MQYNYGEVAVHNVWDSLEREDTQRRKADQARRTDLEWLAGSVRNVTPEYIQQQSDENKIGELIGAVMVQNVLANRNNTIGGEDVSPEVEVSLERVRTLQRQYPNAPEHLRAGWRADVVALDRELAMREEFRRKYGLSNDYGFDQSPARQRAQERLEQERASRVAEEQERQRVAARREKTARLTALAHSLDNKILDILRAYAAAEGLGGRVFSSFQDETFTWHVSTFSQAVILVIALEEDDGQITLKVRADENHHGQILRLRDVVQQHTGYRARAYRYSPGRSMSQRMGSRGWDPAIPGGYREIT